MTNNKICWQYNQSVVFLTLIKHMIHQITIKNGHNSFDTLISFHISHTNHSLSNICNKFPQLNRHVSFLAIVVESLSRLHAKLSLGYHLVD